MEKTGLFPKRKRCGPTNLRQNHSSFEELRGYPDPSNTKQEIEEISVHSNFLISRGHERVLSTFNSEFLPYNRYSGREQ